MDSQTLNYAIVAVAIVITYSVGFWLISARKWFSGPVKQIAGTYTVHLHTLGSSNKSQFRMKAEEMGIDVMGLKDMDQR